MCNIFTLGTVFTRIEIAIYALYLVYCAIEYQSIETIIELITYIICSVLELIGLTKKHFGLTIFSVVFRSIQVSYCLVKAISVIAMQSYHNFCYVDHNGYRQCVDLVSTM